MWISIIKVFAAAILISFVSWLSGKKTSLAGFLTALPLTTLIALVFSKLEWGDQKQSMEYAKSIFIAIPFSLLFFIPFLLSNKLNLGFWPSYVCGSVLLAMGYFAYSYVSKFV